LEARLDSKQRVTSGQCKQLTRGLEHFGQHPVVAAFLGDVERSIGCMPDFSHTRDASDLLDSELVLGLFAAPYNNTFGLDALVFAPCHADVHLARKYPSPSVRAIRVMSCTTGFRLPTCVALFPETYVATSPVLPRHRVYYFIDRFIERYNRITYYTVQRFTHPESFSGLKQSEVTEITDACATWVRLHEHFHRRGYMPLPEHLPRKSSRSAAALEEVRVDALAIITCLDEAALGHNRGRLCAELVLAERLLRYPLQGCPQSNYDSRGTQLLFKYLVSRGVLREMDGSLSLDMGGVADALRELVIIINKNECAMQTGGDARVGSRHRDLVRKLGGYNANRRGFELFPFYRRVRAALEAAGVVLDVTH
jgi:hypothetical protein